MKAVIFDFDGVLVDTPHLLIETEIAYYKTHGLDYDYVHFKRHFAAHPTVISFQMVSDDLHARHGWRFDDTHLDEMVGHIKNIFEEKMTLCNGVTDLLQILDTPKAIATNSTQWQIDLKVDQTGIRPHFGEHIYCACHVEKPKPAPDLYQFAASKLGRFPEDCIVIEDSVTGATAAKAAGMTVIGYVGATHCDADDERHLLDAGASKIIHDIRDVKDLL